MKRKNHAKRDGIKNTYLASAQRDYIAGEVSRDLTKRLLLPEKITRAEENGVLHFHHADYFIQPIFNCSFVRMKDMLKNGTVINGVLIEPPKSFSVACTVMTQIIAAIASNQYGGQSIDISCLGEYVQKSYEKIKKYLTENYGSKMEQYLIDEMIQDMLKSEITSGVQTILYQINTLMTATGNSPSVTFYLSFDEKKDKYIKENVHVFEELLKQRLIGIKNENGEYEIPQFPKIVYVLNEKNNLTGGEFDHLTALAVECSLKHVPIYYLSAKKMQENYEGNVFSPCGSGNFLSPWKNEKGEYQFKGRFNQGLVTINLVQAAIQAEGNEETFWAELDARMELCKDALLYKHYTLLDTLSNISPIHWQYGAIARLNKNERIDEFLKNGYSTLSLGYIGVYETTKLIKGCTMLEKDGQTFCIELLRKMKEKVEQWRQETGIGFVLCATNSKKVPTIFLKKDKERFGTIKEITDKSCYQNAFFMEHEENLDLIERLKLESKLQDLSLGGSISHVQINDAKEAKTIIPWIYENIQYIKLK